MFDKLQPKQVTGGLNDINEPKAFRVSEKSSLFVKQEAGGNNVISDIQNTAWGIPKTSFDYSVFHGIWTYDVNGNIWLGKEDGVEVANLYASTRINSINGTLSLRTTNINGSDTDLISKRSPRYQPNRGHLFSTSIFYQDVETIGASARFGLGVFNTGLIETGAYFEIIDGELYTIIINETIIVKRELIDLSLIGLTIGDLVNGHLFDIQFQWRGAGSYFFYIDQKLVCKCELLGTTEYVTINNPQLPCFFEVKNNTAGKVCELRVGCVDITSEGGQRGALTDASFSNSDLVTIAGSVGLPRKALAIFRVNLLFKGKINTRNLRLLRVTASAYTRACKVGFAITRDPSAINIGNGVFTPVNPYSCLDVIDLSLGYTTSVDFTKTNIAYKASIAPETTWEANEPNADLDFYLSAGDYVIVFARQVKTGTDAQADATIEFGEEI